MKRIILLFLCVLFIAFIWALPGKKGNYVPLIDTKSLFAPNPYKDTIFSGWCTRVRPGDPGTKEVIVMLYGAGQTGVGNLTDTQYIPQFGPEWDIISNGWDQTVSLGNGTHKPTIVSFIQPGNLGFTPQIQFKAALDAFLASRFANIGMKGNMTVVGPSAGGWLGCMFNAATFSSISDTSNFNYFHTEIDLQGVISSDVSGATIAYPQRFGHRAKVSSTGAHPFRYLGIEGTNDESRDIWGRRNNMLDSVPGGQFFGIWTVDGGGAHCCWNDYTNHLQSNFTASNPLFLTTHDAQTSNFLPAGWNMWQFALRGGDTTLVTGPLAANAGADITQGDTISTTSLNGSASGGVTPYTYSWRNIAKPNGNAWCANILNPTQAATQVIGTGVFSSPFQTAYKYELTVTDAASTVSKDTIVVNVTYSSPAPPQATGSGFHYVTSADSLANLGKGLSPARHDLWINGANTDRYAAGGTLNGSIDIRNQFAVYPDARVFVSGGHYFNITLYINKDSVFANKAHPWHLINLNGQVELFHTLILGGNPKYLAFSGQYDSINLMGSPLYRGHANGNYAFSQGTYGWYFNNGYRDIDAPGIDFQHCDSLHDVEISYIEGINGGSYALLMGNTAATTPIYNVKIHDNYFHDSQAEMWYLMRTQSDPQQEADSFEVYNNRLIRSGLEDDQFGQNGSNNNIHNNVHFLSASNWGSAFDVNQAFNNQWFVRKNGNTLNGSIYVGAAEQISSLILNKPASVTLTTDTNYIKNCIFVNGKGSKDLFIGSQNAAPFIFVFDNDYFGLRPHTYLASKVYNNTSNNFTQNPYAILDQQSFLPNINLTFRHIRYDSTGGKTRLDVGGLASVTFSDTARVSTLNPLKFANSGWADNTNFPNQFMRWIDTIYNTFKNENAGVTAVKQNQPFAFGIGDYVEHMGKFYQSKVANNQGHPPAGVTDAFWTLITWTRPDGSISFLPPDDVRLATNDFYGAQGIGLLDQFIEAPVVSAGSNQTLTFPTSSTTLTGTATPNGGTTITSTTWSQLSGPSTATISSPSSLSTSISGLILGIYIFQLSATDSDGNISTASVQIRIQPSGPGSYLIRNRGWRHKYK